MVSIEPADKGTAADGSVRVVYRDGSRECGQVVFRTEGPKAQLLQAAGENTLILDALVRAAQTTGLFGLRAAAGDLTPALLSACRRAGLFTMSLPTNDERTLAGLIRSGVNFIETARPDITSMLLPAGEAEPHQIPLMRF